jgi:hypothetical protein
MVLAYAETLCLTNPGRKSGHFLESMEKKANVILTRVISVGNVTGQSPQLLDRRKNLEKADYVINSILDLSPNINRTNVLSRERG